MHFACSFGTGRTVHFQTIAVHLSPTSIPPFFYILAYAVADVCATSASLRAPRSQVLLPV